MIDDDFDDSTIDCPHCGQSIFEDVDQCPHCRNYLSPADFKKTMPTWVVAIIVLTIIGFLLAAVAIAGGF